MLIWAMLLAETAPAPLHFDLAKLPHSEARCGQQTNGEILVCGSNADRHRLHAIEGDYAETPVRASVGLGGGATLTAHADNALVGGFSSPRAMVTLSVPFGKGKKP